MLKNLRLLVHLIPGKAEGLMQVGLQEPMAAHHPQGNPAPLLGQAHTPVRFVRDQSLSYEALHVLRRRRGNHSHVLADILRFHAVTASFLGAPHELQDVLDDR